MSNRFGTPILVLYLNSNCAKRLVAFRATCGRIAQAIRFKWPSDLLDALLARFENFCDQNFSNLRCGRDLWQLFG